MVDALSSVRWKRHQGALMELSQHGIVLTVEESGGFQAKVFLKRELFVEYDGAGTGGSWFRRSLGLLVDCLNILSALRRVATVEIWQHPSTIYFSRPGICDPIHEISFVWRLERNSR